MPVHFSVPVRHAAITGGRGGGAEISAALVPPAGAGVRAASRFGNGVGNQR
jgi:hypothetical protein